METQTAKSGLQVPAVNGHLAHVDVSGRMAEANARATVDRALASAPTSSTRPRCTVQPSA
jgi:hypothetical protein